MRHATCNLPTRNELARRIYQAVITGREGQLRIAGIVVHSQAWNEAGNEIERLELVLEALGVQP
jgi:hypothetical protein